MASGRSSDAITNDAIGRGRSIAAVSALSNQSSPHRTPPGSGYSPVVTRRTSTLNLVDGVSTFRSATEIRRGFDGTLRAVANIVLG
jgi:hypothetical protein